jgi:glycosyltransferase involved in cell wall biosynthesis
MRITFLLPFNMPSGGERVIFEYANRSKARGHDIAVYYPFFPYLFGKRAYTLSGLIEFAKGVARSLVRWNRVSWRPESKIRFTIIPWASRAFIRDADVVVATAWPTAYTVAGLPKRKGIKVYLIQDYEVWSGPKDFVDGSYRLPLQKVVIASWLKKLMKDEFNSSVSAVITNGVNLERFYNRRKRFGKSPKILMMDSNHERKGVADGITAIELAREKFPKLRLVMFGFRKSQYVPDYAEYHLDPAPDQLRELYSSCDIFLSPSHTEGCQAPPMEAMACKCAVVCTNVGGVPDYTIPDKTALVLPPKRPELISQALMSLLGDSRKLKRISEAGYRHIRQFSWDKATDRLEKVFEEAVRRNKVK